MNGGSPCRVAYSFASATIVGEPYASSTATVTPRPVAASVSYADRSCAGVYPHTANGGCAPKAVGYAVAVSCPKYAEHGCGGPAGAASVGAVPLSPSTVASTSPASTRCDRMRSPLELPVAARVFGLGVVSGCCARYFATCAGVLKCRYCGLCGSDTARARAANSVASGSLTAFPAPAESARRGSALALTPTTAVATSPSSAAATIAAALNRHSAWP